NKALDDIEARWADLLLGKQKLIGKATIFAFDTPRIITMTEADSVRTSDCPPQCKIGKALKDRLNILANVDQLIAENHPQTTVIQTLLNAGVGGVNRANVTRHKQHLLIAIE